MDISSRAFIKDYFKEFEFPSILKFDFSHFKQDLIGGMTSAIVALPLALGFGLLSYNGNPQGAVAGLYGAIFTGILASFFGGTKQQITGPTGGMTVVLTDVYIHYGGVEALLAACIVAGIFQIGFGLLKLGKYVSLVPYPVIVGFTNGIAILIFIQQFKTFNSAPIIALVTMAIIFVVPKINKNLPKSLFGLLFGSILAYLFSSIDFLRLQFGTIQSPFTIADAISTIGTIPSSFQIPSLPHIQWETWQKVVPAGFTISLLGAIETLLASVVADNASNTRHNSNKELVGQGIGNFVAPFFGGVAGTGAIVRTMVNIRAGAKTKISGIIHGVILIVVMLFLGGLASHIPLAALAGVLMMTAIGMFEVEPIQLIPKSPLPDSFVMLTTIAITVFVDLITAVEVGMVMAAFLFIHRMSEMGMVVQSDLNDSFNASMDDAKREILEKNKIIIYDIEGPLFFGAARSFVDTVEKNFDVNVIILDIENVPIMDTTGALALENIVHKLYTDNKKLLIVGIRPKVREILYDLGVTKKIGIGNFIPTMDEAIQYSIDIVNNNIAHEHLASYISENLIMIDVSAKSKEELFLTMIARAAKTGVIKNKSEFLQSVVERELQMPTNIGKNVAVPHGRVKSEKENIVVIFARLAEEIIYEEKTGEKVKFVFLVSTGTNEKEYLTALRMIAKNIQNDAIYKRLLTARNESEIHHIFSELKITNKS
ncbi:MAG: SulP family inorganic anion transporter [Bacteroidota bacterium]|nr:SulP family inorganic anion transporter [Bacteroidota bacterium]